MESLFKCVWMTAGVLSYRLCDRQFDCDHCLVDRALREGGSPPPGDHEGEVLRRAGTPAASTVAGLRFSRSGFYHPSHQWVRVEGGAIVRIGLDDLSRRLFAPVCQIDLPLPGTTLRLEQKSWSVSGDWGRTDLPSPVGGTILSRNEDLIIHPEKLRRTPHREIWLVRLRPSRLQEDLGSLLYGSRVAAWLRTETEGVRNRLLATRAAGAHAIPDGGVLDPDVLDSVASGLRRQLIDDLLFGESRRKKGR